jgi:tetratricopeptide (TPR) repeat protein
VFGHVIGSLFQKRVKETLFFSVMKQSLLLAEQTTNGNFINQSVSQYFFHDSQEFLAFEKSSCYTLAQGFVWKSKKFIENHHLLDRSLREKLESQMGNELTQEEKDVSHLAFLLRDDMTPLEENDPSYGMSDFARSYYQLGKIHYDKADLTQAENNFKKSLSYFESGQDYFYKLKILGFLIRIYSEKLETFEAENCILAAEALMKSLKAHLGTLNAEYYFNFGLVKNYGGDFVEARESFLSAYKKSKEENEPELLAKCLLALATNYYQTKDYETAINFLYQLRQLLKIINKHYLAGAMEFYLGKIYFEMEKYNDSLIAFDNAAKNLQDKKCWNLHGYTLLGKGMVFKMMGQFEKSLLYFKLADDFTDSSVFRRLEGLVKNEIQDVNDSNVDIFLDRTNRKVHEKSLGTIDFKHRFVLLEILFLLAKNSGVYYDKEGLAKAIWKDEYNPLIHDKLIYTSVSRLRKLIEPKSEEEKVESKRTYILRGKDGYTFNPHAKIRFYMEQKTTSYKSIGNVDLSSPI